MRPLSRTPPLPAPSRPCAPSTSPFPCAPPFCVPRIGRGGTNARPSPLRPIASPLPLFTCEQDMQTRTAGQALPLRPCLRLCADGKGHDPLAPNPPFARAPSTCLRKGGAGKAPLCAPASVRMQMGGEVAPPFSPSTHAGEPPVPVYMQIGHGKGHECESTQDSPPRLCEWGTAWEAPLSAACPRFSAKEAHEPGVAPPLPAQERRVKTGHRTGKGVRKWPHAPFAPTFALNGGPGRRTSRAGEPRVTGSSGGSRANGRGWAAHNPGSGVGAPPLLPVYVGMRANEGQGRAGMGRVSNENGCLGGDGPVRGTDAKSSQLPFARMGGLRANPPLAACPHFRAKGALAPLPPRCTGATRERTGHGGPGRHTNQGAPHDLEVRNPAQVSIWGRERGAGAWNGMCAPPLPGDSP
ncbi:hypothetical protein EDB89DRAFT_2246884 [Lactarius sanguifluus]|nr:hypothetical protein EDB89DRAFT_2246884 [Lactarius sanguifluus]